jgi:pimeloyl-ACP methyl ester carboxylesterase
MVGFDAESARLAGEVVMPDGDGPFPGVVFVHGSGPGMHSDWEDEARYLAEGGVAALAYDKPGCGASTGDWTKQSFADRVAETLAAVRFMQRQAGVDAALVGLLGASQGAWIAPMAAAVSDDVSFVVAASASGVGPREQDRFRVEQALRSGEFTEADIERALMRWEARDRRLERGEPAVAILAEEQEVRDEPWYPILDFDEPAVLDFVRRNWTFDPRPHLERCRCPVLAVWGAEDTIVPVERSRAIFAELLGARAELVVVPRSGHHLRIAQDASWGSAALPLVAEWVRSKQGLPAPDAARS